MQVILKQELSDADRKDRNVYSIECGYMDIPNKHKSDLRHFDHHEPEHSHYHCPAALTLIEPIENIENAIIVTSHLDLDTYIGVLRLMGKILPSLDMEIVEELDINSSSALIPPKCKELHYSLGLQELAREIQFPKCLATSQDVTMHYEILYAHTDSQIIIKGKAVLAKSEVVYKNSSILVSKKGWVGLWFLKADETFDPSRPYSDGFQVVVIYRDQYKTISLYGKPGAKFILGNTEWAGIKFEGHKLACDSAPRGRVYCVAEAEAVALQISATIFNDACWFLRQA